MEIKNAPQKIINKEVVKLNSFKTATLLNRISMIPNPNKTNNGYTQLLDLLSDFLFNVKKRIYFEIRFL